MWNLRNKTNEQMKKKTQTNNRKTFFKIRRTDWWLPEARDRDERKKRERDLDKPVSFFSAANENYVLQDVFYFALAVARKLRDKYSDQFSHCNLVFCDKSLPSSFTKSSCFSL